MYICEYCGRHLKKKYEKCPACGSASFRKIQNIGEEIIKVPPKDGYKVNLKNFKYERKAHRPATAVGVWTLGFCMVFSAIFCSVGFNLAKSEPVFGYVFVCFGIFAFISVLSIALKFLKHSKNVIQESNKDIDKVKYLAKNGILIKNLKYTLKPIKGKINGDKTIYQIQVIYEIEKGKTKNFLSEPKYLTALGRDDGTVDLLVDPNDYSNYFVDFEIY